MERHPFHRGFRLRIAALAALTSGGLVVQAHSATLPAITADASGNWSQNARNTAPDPAQLCSVSDGAPTQILGCTASSVPPGASASIPSVMTGGLTMQNIRAVAMNLNGTSPPSVDVRPVIRGATPTPPPPVSTITLAVVGNPATGPWGVTAVPSDTRDLQVSVMLDGLLHHVEHSAPYGYPDDGIPAMTGPGSHLIEFVFYLEGTTTEVARKSITVFEGAVPPPPPTCPPPPKKGDCNLDGLFNLQDIICYVQLLQGP